MFDDICIKLFFYFTTIEFIMQNENTFLHWKKTITLFLTGQAISLFGSALVEFAIIWHITLITKSGVMMMISTLCAFIPRLLISIFAGVWADRYNRKTLILWADAGIALVTLLLAIIFLSGYQELWLIFLVLSIRSIGTGIQAPAVGAIIPQIVPAEHLLRLNGINGSLQSSIMLLAPIVSAGLLSFFQLGALFFVDVITATVGIGILLSLPVKIHKKALQEKKTGYYDDLKEGLRYTKKNVLVREMLMLYAFYFFLITPAAFLSQIFVVREFGDEVWHLSIIEITFSGGMMLGGAMVAWWGGFKNGINTIAASCLLNGFTVALLAIPNFYFFSAIMLFTGISVAYFNATEMTLFQQKIEQDMQGRVFSMVQIVATAVMPLGMLVFGPLSDIVHLKWIFIVSGILIIIQSVTIFLNKKLKTAAMAENPE